VAQASALLVAIVVAVVVWLVVVVDLDGSVRESCTSSAW